MGRKDVWHNAVFHSAAPVTPHTSHKSLLTKDRFLPLPVIIRHDVDVVHTLCNLELSIKLDHNDIPLTTPQSRS
jgi:hypothetical protein